MPPPPKRPFTTSSLTSSIKSTLASQPLLGNLTNIDKLSSQASSLAQKTPFFGALNQQFQQHHSQQQQQQQAQSLGPAQTQSHTQAAYGAGGDGSATGSGRPPNSTPLNSYNIDRTNQTNLGYNNTDMNRDIQNPIQSSSGGRAPVDNAPAVDMSHLTEEERLMIQSVMAKAEMADMGIPVDTSMPSSTNLPSNTSQALTHQRDQQRQAQQQQQQHQHQQYPQQHQQQYHRNNSQQTPQQLQQNQAAHPDQSFSMNRGQTLVNNMQQPQQQQQHPSQTFAPARGASNQQGDLSQAQQVGSQLNQNLGPNFADKNIDPRTGFLGDPSLYNPNQANFQQNNSLIQPLTDVQQRNRDLNISGQFNHQHSLDNTNNQQFNNSQNVGLGYRQNIQQPQMQNEQALMMNNNNVNFLQTNQDPRSQQQQLMRNNANLSFDQALEANNSTINLGGNNQQQQQLNLISSQQTHPSNLIARQDNPMSQSRVTNFNTQSQANNPQSLAEIFSVQSANSGLFGDNNMIQPPPQLQQQPQPFRQQAINNFSQSVDGQNPYSLSSMNQVGGQLVGGSSADLYNSQQEQLRSVHDSRMNPEYFESSANRLAPNQRAIAQHQAKQNNQHNLDTYHLTADLDYVPSYSDHDDSRSPSRNRRKIDQSAASRRRDRDDERLEMVATRQAGMIQRKAVGSNSVREESRGLAGNNSARSRQLPQPGCSMQNRNQLTGGTSAKGEHLTKSLRKRDEAKQKPSRFLTKNIRDDSLYLTESDFEENSSSISESIARNKESSSPTDRKKNDDKIKNVDRKQLGTPTKDTKSTTLDDNEKSETALKLISELKLSEQANQVMEQQQQLIKQSQELIKLQQAQLEQQAEIKKALNEQSGGKNQRENSQELDQTERINNPVLIDQKIQESEKVSLDQRSNQDNKEDSKNTENTELHKKSSLDQQAPSKIIKKKVSQSIDLESDLELERATSLKSKSIRSNRSEDSDSTNDLQLKHNHNHHRAGDHKKPTPTRQQPPATPASLASNSMPERGLNRGDPLQSLTDTTDSDADILSHSGYSRRHRRIANKPKSIVRRREPTGLPPSPLPVAAAIQLHHMQQQHLKQQQNSVRSSLVNLNHMRSRSVTSSPNHFLDRLASGYQTDNQRVRPSSPDTMSEFGGLRRRKRLPEPPTNVVPLTPSMVRRLIQAQKLGGSSRGKFQSQFEPKSSQISTGSYNQPSLERMRSLDSSNFRASSLLSSTAAIADSRNIANPLERQHPSYIGMDLNKSIPSTSVATNLSNINRPQRSTYANSSSILKNTGITDVEETPELDKLISNLDEYYKSDSKYLKNPYLNSTRTLYNPDSNYTNSLVSPLKSRITRDQAAVYSRNPSYLDTVQPPSSLYRAGSLIYDPMTRRNSEGQGSSSTSRNAFRYGITPLEDDAYFNHGNLATTSSSYINPILESHNSDTASSLLSSSRFNRLQPKYPNRDEYQDTNSSILNPSVASQGSQQQWQSPYYKPLPTSSLAASDQSAYPTLNALNGRRQPGHYRPVATNSYSSTMDAVEQPRSFTRNQYNLGVSFDDEPMSQSRHDYTSRYSNNVAPLTKDDIIRNGPKFNSIGYRYKTENQNKYVTEVRTPIECLQSRYPYPYRRILLSKNPKDKIGNGIGVRISGGQPMPNLYDRVNKCIVTSGAFVNEVFQNSRVHFLDEMHQGDQIIEWNGVNLCNRSDGEVQQILLSQFSDDEVEIIYLNKDKFHEVYDLSSAVNSMDHNSNSGLMLDSYPSEINQPVGEYSDGFRFANEPSKRSLRRKLSLSSISHMWSR